MRLRNVTDARTDREIVQKARFSIVVANAIQLFCTSARICEANSEADASSDAAISSGIRSGIHKIGRGDNSGRNPRVTASSFTFLVTETSTFLA
jgi:hypothetical protein